MTSASSPGIAETETTTETETATATAAPGAPARTDYSYTVGWVILAVGLILILGIFAVVAYRGSLLDVEHTGAVVGAVPALTGGS
jgi:hypothetical protein